MASHCINLMLGNVGKPGGVLPPAAAAAELVENHDVAGGARAQVVLIDGANPAYTLPRSSGILDALARAQTVISFAPFLDDSGAWSDVLLPDHHFLEGEAALVPAVSAQPAVTVNAPFVRPLYDTRAVKQTLADLARKMDLTYPSVTAREVVQPLLPSDGAYEDVARAGGLWLEPKSEPAVRRATFGKVTI